MKILKPLVQLYSKIRKTANPVLMPENNAEVWKDVKYYNMYKFSQWVNSFPYLSDRFHGLFDKTEDFEHFADTKSAYGRDCDDFARMWTLWGLYNGYTVYEAIVAKNKFPFKFHVVTILEKYGEYRLCDYKNYGPFNSIEDCKQQLCENWSSYTMDNIIFVYWKV